MVELKVYVLPLVTRTFGDTRVPILNLFVPSVSTSTSNGQDSQPGLQPF